MEPEAIFLALIVFAVIAVGGIGSRCGMAEIENKRVEIQLRHEAEKLCIQSPNCVIDRRAKCVAQ